MDSSNHNSNEDEGKLPNQKELEKELSEYLSKKYGNRIKIISPFIFPKAQPQADDSERGSTEKGNTPAFDMLPEELEAYLDEFVVKQEDAKAILSTKICTHFNRVKHFQETEAARQPQSVGMIKNNVLMIGPTGVGKTYIIKLIAQKTRCPVCEGGCHEIQRNRICGRGRRGPGEGPSGGGRR